MKKIIIRKILLISLVSFVCFYACKKENPVLPPTVTTGVVSNLTSNSLMLSGNISSDGGARITSRGICWSNNINPTISNNKTEEGLGNGSFKSTISGLNPGATYYLRAYAINNIGSSYGEQVEATTLAVLPILTTTPISTISLTTAISGGNITSDGGSPITARGVCWSKNPHPTISHNKTTDGTGTGNFASVVRDLDHASTYYCRAYASNSIGTSYGEEISTTTLLFEDEFNDLSKWILYGSPSPVNISSIYGKTGIFDNKGRLPNNSGAISTGKFTFSSFTRIESDVYLDFSNPPGADDWAGAGVGIANTEYLSWGGYDPAIYFSLMGIGSTFSPSNVKGHAIIYGGYQSESGWIWVQNILADTYKNRWVTLKIIIDLNGIPSFYIDEALLYQGTVPVANSVKTSLLPLWLGDLSSGIAGKAYHNNVRLYRIN